MMVGILYKLILEEDSIGPHLMECGANPNSSVRDWVDENEKGCPHSICIVM